MTMTIIMLVTFLILLLMSVPIGWSLCLSAIAAFVFSGNGFTMVQLVSRLYNGSNSFVLLAIPFFILAGNLMSAGGLSRRLIGFCKSIVGWIRGGLGHVAILTAFIFSAISGSNAATTAAVGGMVIDEMENEGYSKDLSASIVAGAGTTGMVVPPSTAMVLYAASSGTSLTAMFMGGFLPGALMSISMMVLVYFIARRRKIAGQPWGGVKNIFKSFLHSFWAFLMPVIIVGGIYSGIFTATEAAAIACVYSLIISLFVYKGITIKDLPKIFWDSAISGAVGLLVVTCASMMSYIITKEHVAENLCNWFMSVTSSPAILMIFVNILFLIAGCFLSTTAALTLLVPIVFPVCTAYGINPVLLGVILVVNLCIGSLTPPLGGNVYIAASIAKRPIEKVFAAVTPFFLVLLVDLLLLNVFDGIVLLIPRIMGLV